MSNANFRCAGAMHIYFTVPSFRVENKILAQTPVEKISIVVVVNIFLQTFFVTAGARSQ